MRPANEAELAEVISTAAAPLALCGGGTRGGTRGGILTGGMSGVVLYEPGALTLVARAGTPLAEIEAVLAGERQRLAFEPPDLRGVLGTQGVSTLGGVAASNASGPRRVQAGACRDAMLGVRFVDGTGTVIRNGGRVMKNVTGYDLVKLIAGSRGVLGVLTEVSLKVQAMPEAEATLVAEAGVTEGLALLRQALGTPFDISGAAFAGGRAMVRVEGMAGSVAYRAGRLRAALSGGDWSLVEGDESAALWAGVRDVVPLAGRPGALWRLSVVPGEAEVATRALAAAGIAAEAVWDWGGGLCWLACPEGADAVIRAAMAGRGHAMRLRGAGPEPALPPDAPGVAALMRGVRERFDPRGIFAKGTA